VINKGLLEIRPVLFKPDYFEETHFAAMLFGK